MKRIIFVDDEPNILEGLKRMLRGQRHVWDMTFVSSGEQALASMAENPFDVVVTDMKMPTMNGAELLSRVMALHPETVRIVLSGYADMESSMRSVSVTHQFLAKPCAAEDLRACVDRACDLEALLQESTLKSSLGSIAELPAAPEVYKRLTIALGKEEVDIAEIGQIVGEDVAIAAKIIQLVNSSFFGIRREITDLRQATTYLGVSTIRNLVLSFGMFQQFENGPACTGFSIEREQSHAFAAARIAKRLLSDRLGSEHACLAAMLHDVGKLVLATHFPKQLQSILDAGAGVDKTFAAVEQKILGVGHAEIGAYLLGLWGMPFPVVEAVAYHHNPSAAPEQHAFGVLGATHIADALAQEHDARDPKLIQIDEAYLQKLGVLDQLPSWRAMAAEELIA